ncbi:protein MIZU-KUSSEI 1-like [Aristolochia californica]|uniref:protein MIZU-KUSSEI 1-like n=1 Tax=Aristolochia californica TaxID=171875 RepID=UPI0035E0111F
MRLRLHGRFRPSLTRRRPTSAIAPLSPSLQQPLSSTPARSPTLSFPASTPMFPPPHPVQGLPPPSPSTQPPPSTPPRPLLHPSSKKKGTGKFRLFRICHTAFRSFPIIGPSCKLPQTGNGSKHDGHIHGGVRMTGTLFGYRKGRVSLAIQESPKCLPILLLELAIPTTKLLQEMGAGLVRIALECEKKHGSKTQLVDEPLWTIYCNGRKSGYGTKRIPTDEELHLMELLHAISMGAGVVPSDGDDSADGELTYMRANFERVVASKDSETFYMMNPDGNSGPELSIFFVRV